MRQLSGQVCCKAEKYAAVHVARYLDSTYVADPPPNAPKRTGVFIMVDEYRHSSHSGGTVKSNALRAEKPRISIVANSASDCGFVVKQFYAAFGRHEGNKADEYESTRIFWEDGKSLVQTVSEVYGKRDEERKNPKRSRLSPREVLGEIQQNHP